LLYARGAIEARTFDGLVVDPEATGYFIASEQFAVKSDITGDVGIEFSAAGHSVTSTFHIVNRTEITEVELLDVFADPTTNKGRVEAVAKINGVTVRGGPACSWSIVSGGGPGAALAASAGNDLGNPLFVIYNSAIVYGSGDIVVECRANKRVAAQHTIQLAP
jgi:hypothetical protein